jgi:hypothetical protein
VFSLLYLSIKEGRNLKKNEGIPQAVLDKFLKNIKSEEEIEQIDGFEFSEWKAELQKELPPLWESLLESEL